MSIWTTFRPPLGGLDPAHRSLTIGSSEGTLESNPEPRSETPPPPAGLRVFQRPAEMVRLREGSVHAAVRRKVASQVVIGWFETSTKTWWPDTPMEERRTSGHAGPTWHQQDSYRGTSGSRWLSWSSRSFPESRMARRDTRESSGNDADNIGRSWTAWRRDRPATNIPHTAGTHPARAVRDAKCLGRRRPRSKLGAA